ncbi:MAG: sulfatase, partial [Planctomycetes bacterium]|nr:sulfatase [Planctomycetota bacterium]
MQSLYIDRFTNFHYHYNRARYRSINQMDGYRNLSFSSGALVNRFRVLFSILLSLPFPALTAGCGGGDPPANLILITVDTLRPDRLGCYGYPLDTSPALDRSAAEAVLFENAYAHASSTAPSLAALMTSLSPLEAGVPSNAFKLHPDVPTLAERLDRAGFQTAAFVSNMVIRKTVGFETGFSLFNDTLPSQEKVRAHVKERIAEDSTDAAIEWLDTKTPGPFFLWVHYQDPHGPYTPPVDFEKIFADDQSLPSRELTFLEDQTGMGGIPQYQQYEGQRDHRAYSARYLGEIRYFDEQFGRLIGWLKDSGLYDDSMIVFSADHGEGFGEHDYYYAHGEYLYEHQIRVPLIIRIPGRAPGRITRTVALVDLYPTALQALGLEVPDHVQG